MTIRSATRLFLANHLPFVGPVFRQFAAIRDAIRPVRGSYSQHGEDAWFLRELSRWQLNGGVYVDVGSNHPTRISNTYLLYRQGMRGVVVEPNRELVKLHRRVRPGDTAVCVGCGQEARLGVLNLASTPVLSSFLRKSVEGHHGTRILRQEFVAILTLDSILESLDVQWISLLTIDTEGCDVEVLRGARKSLSRALLVCIEVNDAVADARVHEMLVSSHEEVRRFGCNLVFRNRTPPCPVREEQRGQALEQNGDHVAVRGV